LIPGVDPGIAPRAAARRFLLSLRAVLSIIEAAV
jgi:hypothetical protein